NFYMTKKAVKNDNGFTWSIVMDTENPIDPVYLSNELNKRGCSIVDIVKNDDQNWTYNISMQNAKLEAQDILCDTTYNIKKSIKPYLFSIENKAKRVFIDSYPSNRWHPYVVFFDNKLDILSIYENDSTERKVKLQIPEGTKYISVNDKYTISNLKYGLHLYVSSE
ncbi:MAG: hypothetical protein GXO12_04825, partial [Epsilonproteobacteria bacterium]|nr:hypothetical protein [Campylobacterota bacterium]